MNVTTKQGDKGKTQYKNGEFISKGDEKIEFFGCIDELQVALGGIQAPNEELQLFIEDVQRKLFDIYSFSIKEEDVQKIEEMQNTLQSDPNIIFDWNLTTPKTFPIDYARVTSRRLERTFYRCGFEEENQQTKLFLNRLSDCLWILARYLESKPKGQKD